VGFEYSNTTGIGNDRVLERMGQEEKTGLLPNPPTSERLKLFLCGPAEARLPKRERAWGESFNQRQNWGFFRGPELKKQNL